MSLEPTGQVRFRTAGSRWIVLPVLLTLFAAWNPAEAQYPGHTQKEDAKKPAGPRAVAVLEWVGDPTKPVASRIVPVAVFVDGRYQDGGLYMAQPAPLTVETDTLYELEQAGIPKGNFYVAGGENVDGVWFGYGQWKPLGTPKPVKKLRPSKNPPKVVQDADPDRPQFKGNGNSAGSSGGQTGSTQTSSTQGGSTPSSSSSSTTSSSTSDPDKPSLHRRTDSGSGDSGTGSSSGSTTASGSTTTPDDPDKPTLHRRTDSASTDSSGAGTAPDDPDRPKLKKHSDASVASGSGGDNGSPVSSVNEADPDRPKLSHGQPATSQQVLEATKLSGLPPELQQMTAISDESVREEHGFAYPWPSPDDAAKMQAAVEALATKVALGGNASSADPKPVTASKPVSRTASGPRSTLSHAVPPKPLPVALSEKDFRVYELSYNGGATIVFTAKATIGPNNAGVTTEKYITLIAQPDFDGEPQIRFQSITTTKDLDITPRMRLVDAVDTAGKGRADLIFELRRATDRQFAIYHVQGTHAEQAFATESLPYGTPHHNAELKSN